MKFLRTFHFILYAMYIRVYVWISDHFVLQHINSIWWFNQIWVWCCFPPRAHWCVCKFMCSFFFSRVDFLTSCPLQFQLHLHVFIRLCLDKSWRKQKKQQQQIKDVLICSFFDSFCSQFICGFLNQLKNEKSEEKLRQKGARTLNNICCCC